MLDEKFLMSDKNNLSDKNDDSRIITHPGGKIQVLVEVKKPKTLVVASSADVPKLQVKGLEIDPEYIPIPVTPTDKEKVNMSVDTEDIVCVCGKVEKNKIKELESQPNVLRVWKDTKVDFFKKKNDTEFVHVSAQPTAVCPIPPCDCQPGVPKGTIDDVADYLGVKSIWSKGHKGKDIVVGVVDGGITAEGRPIKAADTSNPSWSNKLVKNVIDGPDNDWGTTGVGWGWHGNMSATDVLGMAPEAKIYDIRISGDALSNALSGFQWAINRHRQDGTPHILTNSWGYFQKSWDPDYTTDPDHPFTRKVLEAINEGIIILFAAGNCGATCPDGRCDNDTGTGKSIWGANGHEQVITVAAASKEEKYIGYSSVGPAALHDKKPDITSISHFTGYFNSDSGTSAATPIAAGVVALLKQAEPNLTQDQAKSALMDTAKDIGPLGWDIYTGAGIIQAKAAYDKITTGVIPPIPKPDDGKKCFIATAAYGSEMAPTVQFLREFRDDVVLKSRFKRGFENILGVYYSFSPSIAELMKRNKAFKYTLKYTVVWPFVALSKVTAFLIKLLLIK